MVRSSCGIYNCSKRMARERFGSAPGAGLGMSSCFAKRVSKMANRPRFNATRNERAASIMRNDYVLNAAKVIDDPYILVNVVSRRVKQLRRGYRPLIESLEKLSLEDTALREIAERKITYEIASQEQLESEKPVLRSPANRSAQPRSVAFRAHNVLVSAQAE